MLPRSEIFIGQERLFVFVQIGTVRISRTGKHTAQLLTCVKAAS